MTRLGWAVCCALTAPPLAAQATVSGRIIRLAGGDTVGVAWTPVVLHRVGRAAQGPIDTVVTGPGGGFSFRFASDSIAAFLLSARYAGIEYFSRPVSGDPTHPESAVTLLVADTSSAQAIVARHRTLLISSTDASGTRVVIDWLVLSNRGPLTRVASDTGRPSWIGPLPEAAQAVELADSRLSQFSPDAVAFRRDSVLVFAPLSPGDRELMLQYRIPGTLDRFVVPTTAVDSVFVLIEDERGRVARPALVAGAAEPIEGRPFRRWGGVMAGAGEVEIVLAGSALSSGQLLTILVGVLALGFGVLAWRALARGRARS